MTTKTKALIQQAVRVEFIVNIEADEADLDIDLAELQERIGEHVRGWLKAAHVDQPIADITVSRGPGAYAYFSPEVRNDKFYQPDQRPAKALSISLTDLGYKESK